MARKKYSLRQRLQHMSKRQKIRFTINCILISLCVLCLGVFIYAYPKLQSVSNSIKKIQTEQVEDPDRVIKDDDGYWTILLMGLDSREADGINDMSTTNYGDKRSDCMIIISMNRETKEIKLVSIYRDTVLSMRDIDYFDSTNYCYSKATHAYSWGSANTLPSNKDIDAGPYFTMDMVERNLDIQVDNFVTVNFGVVADVINALGGVTLEVDSAEVAVINPYIEEINQITGSDSEYLYNAGTYTLDGTQATAYGRIRYTAGDDFKRTERQREVLMLAAQQAKNASVNELLDVLELVAPSVRTDLTMEDLNELITKYALSFELDMEDGSRGFPFEKATKTSDSYVYPIDLDTNVVALHEYLYGITDYEVPASVQNISDYIASMYYYGDTSYGDYDNDATWYDDEDEEPIVVTKEPEDDEDSDEDEDEPEETKKPKATKKPEATEKPKATKKPTVTEEPEDVDEPVEPDEPEEPEEPVEPEEPEVTDEPVEPENPVVEDEPEEPVSDDTDESSENEETEN